MLRSIACSDVNNPFPAYLVDGLIFFMQIMTLSKSYKATSNAAKELFRALSPRAFKSPSIWSVRN